MTKTEALILALQGKRVRHGGWYFEHYLYWSDDSAFRDQKKRYLYIGCYPGDGWELFEEPKKMKTVWLWRVKEKYSQNWILMPQFLDENEARRRWTTCKVVKHGEPEEVEVE